MVELERWLPVVGYQAFYSISDMGRVRREMASSGRTWKGRILKAPIRSNGYRAVTLFGQNHRPDKQEIHTLVARAFLGERPEGYVVRHLDGDGLNNLVENLAYGTEVENAHDPAIFGRRPSAHRTNCPRDHALAGANLIPANLRKGHRACLACSRARGRVARNASLDLQETSDRIYAELLGGAA